MPIKLLKDAPKTTGSSGKYHRKDGAKQKLFMNVDEIRVGFQAQNQETLIKHLNVLRNQLSIWPGEIEILPQDERLLLAQRWLENDPGARDIFRIWDGLAQHQNAIFVPLVSVLSSLLTLLSSHYVFQALGQPIVKTLLTPTYVRRLNSFLGGSHTELILVTMKNFNVMSAYAGGKERRSVLEFFGWEIKSLPKLLNMRRSRNAEETFHILEKPDIRTLYILFLLSFINIDTPTQIKTAFLEQHRDQFLAIFKGLVQDSYSVVRKILEVCWNGIWSDPKLKRTLKIGLFNESTIFNIAKLYDRTVAESKDPDNIPADLAHHFLLAICTHPGAGVCFKDRGWYPRETDNDTSILDDDGGDAPLRQRSRNIYNKILANVIKELKPNEDARQQELALKILAACPELVAGYWASAMLTLEPRLSSKWIANISFFTSIISLPIPSSTFYLSDNALYQPAPPPLSNIIENIFPSMNTKVHFSKGLQSSSGLVQHCAAVALAKCLVKYEEVLAFFNKIEVALEENEVEGQWCKRRSDLEREARRRVPDFQVVVAFSQSRFGDPATTSEGGPSAPANPTKTALLSESAQRLLWMYHRCFPRVIAETRFDVGKVLQNFLSETQDVKQEKSPDATARLHIVQQLHALRLLKHSSQFAWSGKIGSSSQSPLSILLKAYTATDVSAIHDTLATLLEHNLSETIMFQEDPHEPYLWLISLPTSRRGPGTASPDGAALTDEASGVVEFLEDCIQRCLKAPYRYIEELYAFGNFEARATIQRGLDAYPSPLLMTVFEQLNIKVSKNLLSPSDVLALASFIRKLVFRLSSKQQDLHLLHAVVDKVNATFHVDRLFPEYPVITAAIRREVALLRTCLSFTSERMSPPTHIPENVLDFLAAIEQISLPTARSARISTASELIDWLRLVDYPLRDEEIRRISIILTKLDRSSLSEVVQNVDPTWGSLWGGLGLVSCFSELRVYIPFDFLFLNSGEAQITNEQCLDILAEVAVGHKPTIVGLRRVIHLIGHRLSGFDGRDEFNNGLLRLLGSILKLSSTILPSSEFAVLKEFIFVESRPIRAYLTSESLSDVVCEGLKRLVGVALDPANVDDRALAAGISTHWLGKVESSLAGVPIQVSLASIWIKYLEPVDIFVILDRFMRGVQIPGPSTVDLLHSILVTTRTLALSEADWEQTLKGQLPQLLNLHSILPGSNILEELIGIAIEASLPAHCDGIQPYKGAFNGTSFVSMLKRVDMRWSKRLNPFPVGLSVGSFLTQETWSSSTVKIVSGLLRRRVLPHITFVSWLYSDHCVGRSVEHFVLVMHAFLDTCYAEKEELPRDGIWTRQFLRLFGVALDNTTPPSLRSIDIDCITLIMRLLPSMNSDFLGIAAHDIGGLPLPALNRDLLVMGRRLFAVAPLEAKPLAIALAEHGVQRIIKFAEDDALFDDFVEELTSLVKLASGIKTHLVETAMGVIVQDRLSSTSAVKLITALISGVQLKPVVINRHLQSILQHPNLFKLCADMEASASRDAITELLHVLFNLYPTNTCQVTHVEPLVRIYRGTLSPADGRILSIFRLFEMERKVSIASLLSRWSSSPNSLSVSPLDALQSLDAILVFRTCLNFPKWRQLKDLSTDKANHSEVQLYDPVFLILLFAQAFAENSTIPTFAWVELFRTNIVSLLIQALSSRDSGIRAISLSQITALWQYLQAADIQEKPHVLHILALLKNLLPPPSDEPSKRLRSHTTLLLLHALRGVFYPSNFIYPITARFLLQRPELDPNDVPMLYNMLYSSSNEWRKERGWIIRFLSDSMKSTEDWRVFKRRHTWDLLATLFQNSEDDLPLRTGIFEVLANLTCNMQATVSLVLKSGLLAWIEIQLLSDKITQGIEWIKILDNIMTIVGLEKLESSTNGEWRAVICRCLLVLLDGTRSPNNSAVFPFVSSSILKLSLLPGTPLPSLPTLLCKATECLRGLESNIIQMSTTPSSIYKPCTRLHEAYNIHEPFPHNDQIQVWGASVEALWRATMTLEQKPASWDILSSRLLFWRALVGADHSIVGEWGRIQVIYTTNIPL